MVVNKLSVAYQERMIIQHKLATKPIQERNHRQGCDGQRSG